MIFHPTRTQTTNSTLQGGNGCKGSDPLTWDNPVYQQTVHDEANGDTSNLLVDDDKDTDDESSGSGISKFLAGLPAGLSGQFGPLSVNNSFGELPHLAGTSTTKGGQGIVSCYEHPVRPYYICVFLKFLSP
jgi:hypothetical protein